MKFHQVPRFVTRSADTPSANPLSRNAFPRFEEVTMDHSHPRGTGGASLWECCVSAHLDGGIPQISPTLCHTPDSAVCTAQPARLSCAGGAP